MTGRGPDASATNSHRIQTDRLLLEVPHLDDAGALFDLTGGEHRAEVTEGLLWDGPDSVSDSRHFIELARAETYGESGFHWVVRDQFGTWAVPGAPLGMIGTRPRAEPGRGDIGYWLGRPYWGQGIMREALTGLLDFCFDELDMEKIEAEIFVGNERSSGLVESLGMTLEGTIRSAHRKQGRWVDVNVYGLLAEEWGARQD